MVYIYIHEQAARKVFIICLWLSSDLNALSFYRAAKKWRVEERKSESVLHLQYLFDSNWPHKRGIFCSDEAKSL